MADRAGGVIGPAYAHDVILHSGLRGRTAARLAAGSALGLTAVGLLAACASPAAGSSGSTGSSASAPAGSASAAPAADPSSAPVTSAAPANAYKDGTYTKTGDYETPGGPESVTATLTVKSDAVTAVKVVGSGNDANTRHYQAAFESGVSKAVVGKKLSDLKVGAISGSSLTGGGFNAAVASIRKAAAA